MYKFSENSKRKLSECHEDIQIICEHLIKYIDFTVVTGYRSPQEQLIKLKEGKSKVKVSKHNSLPSMAIDIQPYPLEVKNGKSKREQFYYLAGYFMGIAKMLKAVGTISHDVRFGGDWDKDGDIKDNSFDDLYHFELI